MVPDDAAPLLVFVNTRSGGCQGEQLITWFRKALNPHQVFDLSNGGPLPGYVCVINHCCLVCPSESVVNRVYTGQTLKSCNSDSVIIQQLKCEVP